MFWVRLASGAVLLVIAAILFWFGALPLALVSCAISLVGYRELIKALAKEEKKKLDCLEMIGYVGIVAYYGMVILTKDSTYQLFVIVATFMATMFAYVITFPKYRIETVVGNIFAYLYAPVMLSFIYLTRELEYGKILVWLILISAWGSDTLAYVCGMLFGKRKVFPKLSPKKTLAGCIGGVAGAMLLGGIYAYFTLYPLMEESMIIPAIALISGVGAVMSMTGDLAASAIKRNVEIKDYGTLIPGHGGIMDRFDSVIVTAPSVYFLSVLVLPFITK